MRGQKALKRDAYPPMISKAIEAAIMAYALVSEGRWAMAIGGEINGHVPGLVYIRTHPGSCPKGRV